MPSGRRRTLPKSAHKSASQATDKTAQKQRPSSFHARNMFHQIKVLRIIVSIHIAMLQTAPIIEFIMEGGKERNETKK
jgi:hypothetical protein